MQNRFLVILVLTLSSLSWGTTQNCSYFHESLPAVHFYRQFFTPHTCYFDVTPHDTQTLIYRSYLFSEQGLFMVFNSYGDGPSSRSTGARVFYFLPRNQFPDRVVRDGDLIVQTATTGTVITINGLTSRLQEISSHRGLGEIHEATTVNRENNGGVEIKNFPGLLIDAGFSIGKNPTANPDGVSILTDHNGKSCRLKNRELFSYDDTGDSTLSHSDQGLKTILAKRCPALEPGY